MLLAALARLSKITGISHQMKMQPVKKSKMPISVAKEDLGERIRRVDVSPLPTNVSKKPTEELAEEAEKPAERLREKSGEKLKKLTVKEGSSKNPPKKKKKKKKNAIDDLFSGLF